MSVKIFTKDKQYFQKNIINTMSEKIINVVLISANPDYITEVFGNILVNNRFDSLIFPTMKAHTFNKEKFNPTLFQTSYYKEKFNNVKRNFSSLNTFASSKRRVIDLSTILSTVLTDKNLSSLTDKQQLGLLVKVFKTIREESNIKNLENIVYIIDRKFYTDFSVNNLVHERKQLGKKGKAAQLSQLNVDNPRLTFTDILLSNRAFINNSVDSTNPTNAPVSTVELGAYDKNYNLNTLQDLLPFPTTDTQSSLLFTDKDSFIIYNEFLDDLVHGNKIMGSFSALDSKLLTHIFNTDDNVDIAKKEEIWTAETILQDQVKKIFKLKASTDVSEIIQSPRIQEIISDFKNNNTSAFSEKQIRDYFTSHIDQIKSDEIVSKVIFEIQEGEIQNKVAEDLKLKYEKLQLMQDEVVKKVLGDVTERRLKTVLEEDAIPNDDILYDEIKVTRLKSFTRQYVENQMHTDKINVLQSLSIDDNKPVYLKNFTEEDTSDNYNFKSTIRAEYQDADGKIHPITFDYPKVNKDGELFLNGSKKVITNQLILLPIIKTGEDTVQVSTNYGKFFITRYGTKVSVFLDQIISACKNNKAKDIFDSIKVGSVKNYNAKNGYINLPIDFTIASNNIVRISSGKNNIDFDLLNGGNKANESVYTIGNIFFENKAYSLYIKNGSYVVSDSANKKALYVDEINALNGSIIKLDRLENILKTFFIKPQGLTIVTQQNKTKNLMFSRVAIGSRIVPLGIVLATYLGIFKFFDKIKVPYYYSEASRQDYSSMEKIKLKDGFLFLDVKDNIANSFLINGLKQIDFASYTYKDLESIDYLLDYYESTYDNRQLIKLFNNIMTKAIDPITLEVLTDLELPTNIADVFIYSNFLLIDNFFKEQNDMNNYRIRNIELINTLMYATLSDAVNDFKSGRNSSGKTRISVQPDALIKRLNAAENVENSNLLNPVQSIEEKTKVTYKGPNGLNLDQAFKISMRKFNNSMRGVVGPSSPIGSNVGIVRYLTYKPHIATTRGYLNLKNDKSENFSELLNVTELLNPYTSRHSDPPRLAMSTAQTKQFVPVIGQTPPLVGSGIEKVLPYITNSEFVTKSAGTGTVTKIDENKKIIYIEYKDATKEAISYKTKLGKHSEGYFISINPTLNVKAGQTIKKDDIIFYDENYFQKTPFGLTYGGGVLAKVALATLDATHEDGSAISANLANKLAADITYKKSVTMSMKSNILKMVNIDAEIKSGDTILLYEEGFEDSASKLLDKIDIDMMASLSEYGQNTIQSKYNGRIKDIKIHWNRPLEEASESVKKMIENYVKYHTKHSNEIHKNTNIDKIIETPSLDMVPYDKINGEDVNGLLIEIYIETREGMHVGDKITMQVATKSIVSTILEEDEYIRSEYRSDVPIDVMLSPMSVVGRQTVDLFLAMWSNKVLMELKDQVVEMATKAGDI